MPVVLPDQIIHTINTHGEKAYPYECCGMMLGTQEEGGPRVRMAIPIENSQGENRQRRFLITPAQYLDAEHLAAARHLDLLGFYHSHPDHPAIPSEFDTAHALPSFVYVIVSVVKGRAGELTAWTLMNDRDRFEQQMVNSNVGRSRPAENTSISHDIKEE